MFLLFYFLKIVLVKFMLIDLYWVDSRGERPGSPRKRLLPLVQLPGRVNWYLVLLTFSPLSTTHLLWVLEVFPLCSCFVSMEEAVYLLNSYWISTCMLIAACDWFVWTGNNGSHYWYVLCNVGVVYICVISFVLYFVITWSVKTLTLPVIKWI